jgi:glycosyltransferase involved in cell wall biosynthesis
MPSMAPFYRARHAAAELLRRHVIHRHPPYISQANLRRFRREMDRRPRIDLPSEPPGSIAVVVPCYGHAAYLPLMFESVTSQTRPPDEVILVDDASPDDTARVLRRLMAEAAPQDGSYRILTNERNLGQAASLNRAIAAASTDLIMVLNDDDYLMHDAVESMLDLFAGHRELALIGAIAIHFAGDDELAAAPKMSVDHGVPGSPLRIHRPEDVGGYRRYTDLNMTHSGSCFLKVAWAAVGGYRRKAERCVPHSDRDFQLLINCLWPVGVAGETPYSFWRSNSSVDSGRES